MIVNRKGKKIVIKPTELNLETDKVYCKTYHITNNGEHLTKWKSGHTPYNKGVKRNFTPITVFKKGEQPWNSGLSKKDDIRLVKSAKNNSVSLKKYFYKMTY